MGIYPRHTQIYAICLYFKKETAKIREIMNVENENAVASGWQFLKYKMKQIYPRFVKMLYSCKNLCWIAQLLKEEIADLEKTKKMIYNDIKRYQEALGRQEKEAYFSIEEEKKVEQALRRRQASLYHRKQQVDKIEQELLIKQDELEIAIKDTNLALNSYYRLSDEEIALFEKQRPLILEGIEKYGSISLAVKNNAKITMRVSTIMYYANKHRQFKEDMEIAKKVFKDNLDAEILDRALNGTVNPVFQKGEHIGDFAVKDNKLLVEVAKAKLPEIYNPRVYAAANPQSAGGTTINILSFDGVDETKRGYARNIGVVKSVDDTGRVERITQSKKMIDFYKDKPGVEIINAEAIQKSPDELLDPDTILLSDEENKEA